MELLRHFIVKRAVVGGNSFLQSFALLMEDGRSQHIEEKRWSLCL